MSIHAHLDSVVSALPGRAVYLACAVLLASAALTWLVRRRALAQGMLDHPNARSSHSVATPRGGGLGIVIACTAGLLILWFWKLVDSRLLVALLGGGSAVAIVGYFDDRSSLPVLVRIAVHFASAIWAVFALGGLNGIQWGAEILDTGLIGNGLAVLGVVWALNLFNFMDGIDGIAGSEAVFITMGAILVATGNSAGAVAVVSVVVAAASLGFLRWNWPPATIFMGDVGSGYLGYVLAVLALAAARENAVMPYVWLILGGTFFVDATVTLLRRLLRGERVFEAHRSHAYQWLARRWRSHRRVTVVVAIVNFVWLLPWACIALTDPLHAGRSMCIALAPLVVLALLAGGGRREGSLP